MINKWGWFYVVIFLFHFFHLILIFFLLEMRMNQTKWHKGLGHIQLQSVENWSCTCQNLSVHTARVTKQYTGSPVDHGCAHKNGTCTYLYGEYEKWKWYKIHIKRVLADNKTKMKQKMHNVNVIGKYMYESFFNMNKSKWKKKKKKPKKW